MAKEKKAIRKPKKKRADKYETKVNTDLSFDQLVDVMLKPKSKK